MDLVGVVRADGVASPSGGLHPWVDRAFVTPRHDGVATFMVGYALGDLSELVLPEPSKSVKRVGAREAARKIRAAKP